MDFQYVHDVEVRPLFDGDRGQSYDLAREERTTGEVIRRDTATRLWSLRIYGHDRLVNFVLDVSLKR